MSANALNAFVDVHELRKEAGRWLKGLRESRGLSQREVAEKTGTEYYTFVSQLETGRGRIPAEHYTLWAETLGVEPKVFVRTLMRYYDPVTHDILFPRQAAQ
jgi:transcriptional regulator with XRE-family HTH domain